MLENATNKNEGHDDIFLGKNCLFFTATVLQKFYLFNKHFGETSSAQVYKQQFCI